MDAATLPAIEMHATPRQLKRLFRAACVTLGLLVCLPGCASYSGDDDGRFVGEDDQRQSLEVINRLRQDSVTGRESIGVSANDGVVTLYGVVRSPHVRARALGIARGTPGVIGVVDKLTR